MINTKNGDNMKMEVMMEHHKCHRYWELGNQNISRNMKLSAN